MGNLYSNGNGLHFYENKNDVAVNVTLKQGIATPCFKVVYVQFLLLLLYQ